MVRWPHTADLEFVVQEPQLGTAHALLTTEPLLRRPGRNAAPPFRRRARLSAATLQELVRVHTEAAAATTVVTARVENPHGYGRIVRDGEKIARIVEEKDASPAERAITEINAGIYAFDLAGLFERCAASEPRMPSANTTFRISSPFIAPADRGVETVTVADAARNPGNQQPRGTGQCQPESPTAEERGADGRRVSIEDPATTYIDLDVQVGADTIIKPGVSLEKGPILGSECVVHSGVRIVHSTIGDRVRRARSLPGDR